MLRQIAFIAAVASVVFFGSQRAESADKADDAERPRHLAEIPHTRHRRIFQAQADRQLSDRVLEQGLHNALALLPPAPQDA